MYPFLRERGLSVPDADMLMRLAEILETTVSTLLGAAIHDERESDDIAEQLARINEQLAVKNRRSRRIWRTVAAVLIALAVIYILLIALNVIAFESLKSTGGARCVKRAMLKSYPKNSKKPPMGGFFRL